MALGIASFVTGIEHPPLHVEMEGTGVKASIRVVVDDPSTADVDALLSALVDVVKESIDHAPWA